ncbi:MAG: nucleotidyltransferase family protein [Saprospiraceae bacterium]|nr:nucleotidyltransferase family protein [Saprospiraceae bacterium]
MRAMIFAAGLGTRLRPLTENRPKALIEVAGMALLEFSIRRLKLFGFREIMINIHYHGEQILSFLEKNNGFGIHIEVSDERDLLLDTGGGLKKAAWFLDGGPFLVYNADILSDLDLGKLYETHLGSDRLATLAVQHRSSSRAFLFDENDDLCGWQNTATGEVKRSRPSETATPWSFSGIHVLSPEIFTFMPEARPVFSIVDVYLEAAASRVIAAYRHNGGIWVDVGKLSELDKAAGVIHQIPIAPKD